VVTCIRGVVERAEDWSKGVFDCHMMVAEVGIPPTFPRKRAVLTACECSPRNGSTILRRRDATFTVSTTRLRKLRRLPIPRVPS
jgi:hypothetical protein